MTRLLIQVRRGLVMYCLAITCIAGCDQEPAKPGVTPAAVPVKVAATTGNNRSSAVANKPDVDSPLRFTDMTGKSGVSFTYYGSPGPELYMTEQNGGGTALFDYDGDGVLDLFFTNGSHFQRPAEGVGATQRLYRARGAFQFSDVTATTRLTAYGFGMGPAAADYDNDGFVDLFVAGYGANHLYRNQGDGTFIEVPLPALPKSTTWGTSAAFADLDADGCLDLYVVNYVDWSKDDPPCYSEHQGQPIQISCGPIGRMGQADALYRNQGDGHFENVAESAGVALVADGKGLAVAIADLNGDGRLDIYVANDTTRNFLFRNQGQMKFQEEGVLLGVAFSDDGVAGSSMGIACGDYNRDGRFDLFVTNFLNQARDAFENLGEAGFRAVNTQLGLDTASRSTLSFGIVLSDFDLDGWPDLFAANGHIWDFRPLGLQYEFEMQPHLFWNRKGKRFTDVSSQAGDYFRHKWLGRAVSTGDMDQDGDTDLVVGQLLKPSVLLRNDSQRQGESIRMKFIGVQSARQPLGCRVEVEFDDSTVTAIPIPSGGSFQASSEDVVIVARPSGRTVKEVRIVWPNGVTEGWSNPSISGLLLLIEGTGKVVDRSGTNTPQ